MGNLNQSICTHEERNTRVDWVISRLCQMTPRHVLRDEIEKKWGYSRSGAYELIRDGMAQLQDDVNVDRQAYLAECIGTLRMITALSIQQGNLGAAASSIAISCKLLGISEPPKPVKLKFLSSGVATCEK